MTMMLASVRSLDEALIGLEGGADLIDLKEPSRGALGALDHAAVRICVQAIGARRPVSATIGDLPSMDPQAMTAAVERMAATGVDFIKIGFFSHPRALECATALADLTCETQLIAVIFADEPWSMDPSPSGIPGRSPELWSQTGYGQRPVSPWGIPRNPFRGAGVRDDLIPLINALADAGFAGAMLDTAHKTGKTLRDWRAGKELEEFVTRGRGHGLLTGLAGSLRREDVLPLLAIGPDYLGFRGALCRDGERAKILDQEAFAAIRAAIPQGTVRSRRAAA
jgi:dihydroneopterin aldolase